MRLIESDELAILPVHRKNEVLSFLKAPLLDLSISRSVTRARGWGIPVPGDPSQIIYVWFDALANYLREPTHWSEASRIPHVIGKGITRFSRGVLACDIAFGGPAPADRRFSCMDT